MECDVAAVKADGAGGPGRRHQSVPPPPLPLLPPPCATILAAPPRHDAMQTSTPSQQLTLSWSLRWNVKDLVGAETACPAWNGTGFVPDAAAHTASVPRVQADQAQLDAYVAKTCADSTGGAAALNADLLAGGPAAQMAFLASVQSCTATSPKLAQAVSWLGQAGWLR